MCPVACVTTAGHIMSGFLCSLAWILPCFAPTPILVFPFSQEVSTLEKFTVSATIDYNVAANNQTYVLAALSQNFT